MSRKSKSSRSLDPARPFDPAVWKQAANTVRKYQVLSWYDEDENAYFGQCVEIPNCMSHGATPAERDAMVAEATTLCVACMLEQGQRPPTPLSESARTTQVNIRLTPREKTILEHAAQAAGFRGVSDYVRARVLSA
jgi:predicted RNase H-like HicB family nuclease